MYFFSHLLCLCPWWGAEHAGFRAPLRTPSGRSLGHPANSGSPRKLQAREHPLTPSPCLAGGSLGGVSPRFPIAPRRDGGVFGCPPLGRGLIAGPEHPANPLRAEARFLLESVNSSSTAKNGPRCSRDTLPRTGGDRGRAPGAPQQRPPLWRQPRPARPRGRARPRPAVTWPSAPRPRHLPAPRRPP